MQEMPLTFIRRTHHILSELHLTNAHKEI